MLFESSESFHSVSIRPEYQEERGYRSRAENFGVFVVSPLLSESEDVMPFIVIRMEKELPPQNGVIRSYRVTEYQYGILPTRLDSCYWAYTEEIMQDSIDRTLENFVSGKIRVLPLNVRIGKNGGVPELRMNRHHLRLLMREEKYSGLQTFLDLSEKIAAIIIADRNLIENGEFPALSDQMAIKKYKQLDVLR